ncbi:MAG: hypothetical protein M1820_003528 [Bogoriella megaspora]|nr:MAG: hypothetical protein M1820_003528 [Bogoriella megaspora]
MSSYLSNLLTTTTSRYATLRRALLPDETDGDTEDDSHITRVLRAYYTEKGRPFPPWLPPDPRAPQPPPQQFVTSSSVGRSYGQLTPSGQPAGPTRGSSGGGGLSDLWDSGPSTQNNAGASVPNSLRAGRGARMGASSAASSRSGGGFVDAYSGGGGGTVEQATARPLPSQRAGSYQSSQFANIAANRAAAESPQTNGGGGGGGGAATAQERLKARLWGGSRSGSPTPSNASASTGYGDERAGAGYGAGGRNPYADEGGGGGKVGLPSGPRPRRF